MNIDQNLSDELRSLIKKIEELEEIYHQASELHGNLDEGSVGHWSPSEILKRINAIQSLVDQIEIEIDKLEMRVSAIEHTGFRLRTEGP